jgi:hypothetical protein
MHCTPMRCHVYPACNPTSVEQHALMHRVRRHGNSSGRIRDVLLLRLDGLLTFLTDPHVIRRILLHLGEPVELPEVAPARSSPGGGWLFR